MARQQWEIDEMVAQAEFKRQRGEKLTEKEWMLIQFAFPPSCSSCGGRHSHIGVEEISGE